MQAIIIKKTQNNEAQRKVHNFFYKEFKRIYRNLAVENKKTNDLKIKRNIRVENEENLTSRK